MIGFVLLFVWLLRLLRLRRLWLGGRVGIRGVGTDGNTLLDTEEVTMLTILRMNSKFMEYMRANYNAESRQKFKTTVVDA